MTKYIILLIAVLSTNAMADNTNSLDAFCIGVPDAVYTSQTNKIANLCYALWGGQLSKDEANKGWKKVRQKNDASKVWWIYDITYRQIKDNLSDARIAQLKEILSDANVKWERDWIGGVMAKYNLEYVEVTP